MIDNIPGGFLALDDEGIIKAVNERSCTLTGYKKTELINSHVKRILTPGSTIFFQTHLYPLIKIEHHAKEIYLSLLSAEEEKIPVLVNAEKRDVEDGSSLYCCLVLPVERRSEYEDQLLHAKKKAEKKSEQKERFLSMISHELRTPLNTILGMVDLLSEELNGNAGNEEREYLSLIKSAGKNLGRLADDILNFAKLETGYFEIAKEPFSLEEAIIKAYMMAMRKADEKGIKLIRHQKTELTVHADADRLQQILLNLLHNAIKFTDRGGIVQLHTDQDDQFAYIYVKDNGIGMSADKQDRIFDPFVQIEHNSHTGNDSGFGLGLPISRKLARLMGGDLQVESTPGRGSVFTVRLPIAESPAS
ncbi:ATP-binding protein [Halalkalibaculum sp. DA3122]|uniref:PAS domain-containing sensor histidine kinase n=1 Tax=Halalkalibaculum sp. DA3122 TaxID=3373607 RepID=UPI0037550C91